MLLSNYQNEYQKIEQIAEIMMRMIEEYKGELQTKMTNKMIS